jgi:peroxiredoxin
MEAKLHCRLFRKGSLLQPDEFFIRLEPEFVMKRSPDPIVLLLLALSLGTNVFLYRHQVRAGRAIEPLRVGQQVPEFTATSFGGDVVRVRFDRPVVLYVFSPSCIWCERNLENARRLAAHVAGKYEFIAVALDGKNLSEYLKRQQLAWTILTNVPAQVQQAYGMLTTPQTIVVGTRGRVLHVWSGAFMGDTASEIERAFGVRLTRVER